MQGEYLAPLDQLLILSDQVYDSLEDLSKPLIVIGGQAINYWINYFQLTSQISDIDLLSATSYDIDYSCSSADFELLAKSWNVETRKPSIDDITPELGNILLIDSTTNSIKAFEGAKFVDYYEVTYHNREAPNVVDALELPHGFKRNDFLGRKLEQHTSALNFPDELGRDAHPMLRILNPIGCLKSRLHNLMSLSHVKNSDNEKVRIKLMLLSIIEFLSDELSLGGFKHVKKYIDLLLLISKTHLGFKLDCVYGLDIPATIEIFIEKNRAQVPDKFVNFELALWKNGYDKKRKRMYDFF